MTFVLMFILIAGALAIFSVFAFFFVLAKILGAAIWGLSLPLRAMKGRPQQAKQMFPRAMPAGPRCANPGCGADLLAEARFCGRCGTAVTAGSLIHYEPLPDATYVTQRMKRKLRKGQWRIIDGVCMRPTVIPPRRSRVSRVA